MKVLPLALAMLCVVRAAAGPVGPSDAQAVAATGYSGAYLGSIGLSLAADPLYGSRLLDSFELHLRCVAAMTSPRAVTDYLEMTVIGSGGRSAKELRAVLGKEPMDTQRAAALMLAHLLARPEAFQEVLGGLEARKAGLGAHMTKLLRETRGQGDRSLIATLRKMGEVKPKVTALTYDRFGQIGWIFDGIGFDGRDTVHQSGPVSLPAGVVGYGPDGRLRRSDIKPRLE